MTSFLIGSLCEAALLFWGSGLLSGLFNLLSNYPVLRDLPSTWPRLNIAIQRETSLPAPVQKVLVAKMMMSAVGACKIGAVAAERPRLPGWPGYCWTGLMFSRQVWLLVFFRRLAKHLPPVGKKTKSYPKSSSVLAKLERSVRWTVSGRNTWSLSRRYVLV